MNQVKISKNVKTPIQPGMFGLFFEDINYAADGGLYAEMLENRNFEFQESRGYYDNYSQDFDGLYGWSACRGHGKLALDTQKPQNEVNQHYLHFTAMEAGDGFTNKAYDGICLNKGENYRVSFWARTSAFGGKVLVHVEKDGQLYTDQAEIAGLTGEWKKYELTLTAAAQVRSASFVICLSEAGSVDFDMISMMPENAVCGLFRRDLAELLKELQPGFLRFPGGCIVEGNTLDNRYRWKESVGPMEERRVNWSRWSVHDTKEECGYKTPFSHYNQTLGMGYYEYFILCEYLGASPVPVMNVGLACQYQSTQKVASDSVEFKEFVQDALDLIEFANGDVSTKWGALRAACGHPEPFGLRMLGIGNEQWETEEVDFFHRYELFEQAIHEKYPEIRLLGSAGPNVNSKEYEAAWNWIRPAAEKKENFVYAVDEHYYVPPKWCFDNTGFYDNYPRNVKVFAGEYAAHPQGIEDIALRNNMEAALAEAALLTGIERNADVVVLACYAPLFARIGYTQWSPDLIWFDDVHAYGTPSYYVQKLYSVHTGQEELEIKPALGEGLYTAVSYDREQGEVIVKLINAGEKAETVSLGLEEWSCSGKLTRIELCADSLQQVNSIAAPDRITDRQTRESFAGNEVSTEIKPYSVTVLRIAAE